MPKYDLNRKDTDRYITMDGAKLQEPQRATGSQRMLRTDRIALYMNKIYL